MNSRLERNVRSAGEDLRQSLLPVFQAEAAERLDAMNVVLGKLDKADEPLERQALLERLGRHAHSLKGGARAVDLTHVECICAGLEAAFAALKATRLQSATVAAMRAVVGLVHDLLYNGVVPAEQTGRALHMIDSIMPSPEKGNGSRAASTLPKQRKCNESNSRTTNAGRRPAGEYKVLIADDSMTSRVHLKRILQTAGYDVTDVCDGTEAIAVLQREPIDLLVSDVEMPRADGLELTAWIRAHPQLRRLAVILVSGLEGQADLRRGRQAGADDYIPRSQLSGARLLDAVARHLPDRSRTSSP